VGEHLDRQFCGQPVDEVDPADLWGKWIEHLRTV
jgi:hypothetical protein